MNRKKTHKLSTIQKLIITIIITAFILVFIVIINALVFSKENVIKSKINHLANIYYENHIYDEDIKTALYKYKDIGLSVIPLRQILLYDDKNHQDAEYIKQYCDYNKTYIRFYPKEPYNKTNVRVDITYSCEF